MCVTFTIVPNLRVSLRTASVAVELHRHSHRVLIIHLYDPLEMCGLAGMNEFRGLAIAIRRGVVLVGDLVFPAVMRVCSGFLATGFTYARAV